MATDPGGALNYAEKMLLLRRRFESDFSLALERLGALHAGMKDVFGIEIERPKSAISILEKTGIESTSSPLDDMLIFTRSSIAQILREVDMDQSAIFTVSLRDNLTDEKWEILTNMKSDISFEFKESDGLGLKKLRLRGVSAAAIWEGDAGLITLSISPPKEGRYYSSSDLRTVSQSHLGRLVVGNIADHRLSRPLEIHGSQTDRSMHPKDPRKGPREKTRPTGSEPVAPVSYTHLRRRRCKRP